MAKITFEDKIPSIGDNPENWTPDMVVSADNLNEIKSSVNDLYDVVEGQIKKIVLGDFEIDHENGVSDFYVGVNPDDMQTGGAGAATGGSPVRLNLTPSNSAWRSEDFKGRILGARIFTNIVEDDSNSNFDPNNNGFVVTIRQGYMNGSNSAASGDRVVSYFVKEPINDGEFYFITAINNGTLNDPIQIGDKGTFYADAEVDSNPNNEIKQIGLGGQYSRYYYTLTFSIAESVKTKNYKFRVHLYYVDEQ